MSQEESDREEKVQIAFKEEKEIPQFPPNHQVRSYLLLVNHKSALSLYCPKRSEFYVSHFSFQSSDENSEQKSEKLTEFDITKEFIPKFQVINFDII